MSARHTATRDSLPLATVLLILGVLGMSGTIGTDAWWWSIPAVLCLVLVPGMISDAAADEVEARQNDSKPGQ
jgi:hypothetical protein